VSREYEGGVELFDVDPHAAQVQRLAHTVSYLCAASSSPDTLEIGTRRFCPDIVSRNPASVSRKLVPIAKSRFVVTQRFLGQWSREGRVRHGVEAESEAGDSTRRALGRRLREALRGKVSSREADRKALRKAFDYCREDDVLVVARLGRLGRSQGELIYLVGELEDRGVDAAKAVLDYAVKATEQEQIVERLEALERRASEDGTLRGEAA
jgi:hypothetical protein